MAGLVALLALVPLSAALGLTDPYRKNSGGQVKHQHQAHFRAYVPQFTAEPGLTVSIKDAREDWKGKLAGSTSVTLGNEDTVGSLKIADMSFTRSNLGDTGAAVVFQQAYHPPDELSPGGELLGTEITFNSAKTGAMSGDEKQGRACQAIGGVLGLESGGYTGSVGPRDDCMSNAVAHKFVKSESIAEIDEYYGPNLTGLSGSLDHRGLRRNRSNYSVTATAKGHALTSLNVTLAGQTLASASSSSCGDNCSLIASADNISLASFPRGRAYLKAEVQNQFGQTDATGRWVYIDTPEFFGFNDFIARSEWTADTDPNRLVTPYDHARRAGANLARMGILWDQALPCAGEVYAGATGWGEYDAAYNRILYEGARPLIVVMGAGTCRDNPADCTDMITNGTTNPSIRRWQLPAENSQTYVQWALFVRDVVNRYPQAIGIEVWNEPNTAVFWGGCTPDPAHYAELLRWGHLGVAISNHPQMPTVTAGLVSGTSNKFAGSTVTRRLEWTSFLSTIIAAGARNNSEAIGLHPYHADTDCTNPERDLYLESVQEQIDDARERVGSDPLWVTEFGVSTSFPAGDCRKAAAEGNVGDQGERLVDAYRIFQEAEIEVAVVHRLVDLSSAYMSASGLSTGEREYGLRSLSSGAAPHGNYWGNRSDAKQSYCELADERDYHPC